MDFTGDLPIYLQIAQQLRAQILAGAQKDGDQLMSTTAFSATYRINPATVAKAFAVLVEEGLVEKRRGIGMFVAAGAGEKLRNEERARYYSEVLLPALQTGRTLGVDETEMAQVVAEFLSNGKAEK